MSDFTNSLIQAKGYLIAIDLQVGSCIMHLVGAVPRIGEQNAKDSGVVRKHIFRRDECEPAGTFV
ncbi:hypothetical protein D3C86_1685350 [compost metagenome]